MREIKRISIFCGYGCQAIFDNPRMRKSYLRKYYKTETLGADVESVSTTGGRQANSILFYVLGRGTDIKREDGINNFVITLTQVSTGKTGTVTISAGGEVSYSVQ
jgi:hypothetical protein